MGQVRTWKVLHDGMKVGDETRFFGDFMPEAAEFPNLRAYLNSGYLEEVYVEQEVLDQWRADKDAQKEADLAETDDSAAPDGDEEEKTTVKIPKSKKKTAKKTVKKKTAKSVKEKSDERLAEQPV